MSASRDPDGSRRGPTGEGTGRLGGEGPGARGGGEGMREGVRPRAGSVPAGLTADDRRMLLALARHAVEAAVQRLPGPPVEDVPEGLMRPGGAFVSIHRGEELRGCIGLVRAVRPLAQAVVEMAAAAATQDSRFDPIEPAELPDLTLEISVLTPLEALPPGELDRIEVGKHGLYVVMGSRAGLLLPQVATDQGWDRDEFVRQTLHKAGLSPRLPPPPSAVVHIFTAEVFSEDVG